MPRRRPAANLLRNPIVAAVRARSVRRFSRRGLCPLVTRRSGTLSGVRPPTQSPSSSCGPSACGQPPVSGRFRAAEFARGLRVIRLADENLHTKQPR